VDFDLLEERRLLSEVVTINTPPSVQVSNQQQTMVFQLNRTADPNIQPPDNLPALTVICNTIDGTAQSGRDYDAVKDQTVTFLKGANTANVPVIINPASGWTGEASRTFTLKVTAAQLPLFETPSAPFPSQRGAVDIASGNFEGSSSTDLVLGSLVNTLDVFDGTTSPPYYLANPRSVPTVGNVVSLATGDLKNNGMSSLAVSESSNKQGVKSTIEFFEQVNGILTHTGQQDLSDHQFGGSIAVAANPGEPGTPHYFAVAINAEPGLATPMLYIGRIKPDGSLDTGYQEHHNPGVTFSSVVFGDFNGDGIPDIAAAEPKLGEVHVYQGSSTSGGLRWDEVQPPLGGFSIGGSLSLASGRFKGSASADLAVCDTSAGNVTIELSQGAGNIQFHPGKSYNVANQPGAIRATTFSPGGKVSLGVVTTDGASFLAGNGDGTFQAPISISTGSSSSGIAFADFNGDGSTDVTLSSASVPGLKVAAQIGVDIGGASATGTILGPSASLSGGAGPISENGGTTTVTATLPAAITTNAVLTLGFSGDLLPPGNYTVSGANYDATSQQLTILAGTTSSSITLTGKLDGHFGKSTDTTSIAITAATGTAFNPAPVTVTFNEADPPPTVTLSPASATIPENGGTAVITATLSATSGVDTTVNLGFIGTAVLGTNFDTKINGVTGATTLTIPAGSISASFSIIAKLDNIYGPDLNLSVLINSVQNGTPGGSPVAITITEGDPAPQVTLTPPTSTLAEVGGSAKLTFSLNEVSGVDTTLTLAFGGTATLDMDFTASGHNYDSTKKTLVIPAGQQSAVLTLLGKNNQTFGPDLTATIAIQSAVNAIVIGNPVSTVTITEGDPGPTVTLAITPTSIDEIGGQAQMTATIPKAYNKDVTINLTFGGSAKLGTQYTVSGTNFVPPSSLTIPAGTTQSTLVLQALDDGLYGPNVNAVVSVQSVVHGTYPGGPQTVTITEDDAQPSVSLAATNGSFGENGGTDTVTATLSQVSGVATTVPLTFTGTAVLGTNYMVGGAGYNPNTHNLVIPVGQLSSTIVLTGISDGLYGPDLIAQIGVAATTGAPPFTGSIVTETIKESSPPPTISMNNVGVSETAGSAVFTVTLSAASLLPVTVVYATSDGTAIAGVDYQTTSGTLTFNPTTSSGPGDTTKTITVPVLNDHLFGPPSKQFNLTLTVNSGATPASLQRTGTITEADAPPQITGDNFSITKPTSGQQQASVTFHLSEASSQSTTVNYQTADITAKAGTDYVAANGVVTFPPGTTTATIPVTIIGNATPTGTLIFGVNLTSPIGAVISTPQVIGTILDVNPAVGLSVADTVVYVPGPNPVQALFAVTLAPARLGQVVTVKYTTVDGTAVAGKDYLATQDIATFEPGQTTYIVPVTVFGAMTQRPNLEFSLQLSDANPTGTTIAIAQATATIINTVVVPVISINSVQVLKPSSGTTPAVFTVSLSQPTQEIVKVNYATSNGTAIAGVDYQAASDTLTFSPGQTTQQILVQVLPSTRYNQNAVFFVTLSSAVGASISPTGNQGTGTILNQVGPPVLSISDPTVTKPVAGTSPAVFTVTLSSPSALVTTVDYATANGTAVAGVDYQAAFGVVTFAPGETSKQFSVQVFGNRILTGTRTFVVNLSQPVNAGLAVSQATATILDVNSLIVTNTNDDGPGSLRWALLTANATPGLDTVTFAIPAPAPIVINVRSPLPAITDPAIIDGTSQPGYFGAPLIELNGAAAGSGTNGLFVEAGNSVVKGLSIVNFDGSGLFFEGLGGNLAEGNFLGVAPDGNTALGNHFYGMLIHNSANNVVGGLAGGTANVISGNHMGGVYLGFEAAYGNLIIGNMIGTNAAGNMPVANNLNGVFVDYAPNNVIQSNVISGNYGNGVKLYGPDSVGDKVISNIIGLSAQGDRPIPNGEKPFTVIPASNRRFLFPTSGPSRNITYSNGQRFRPASSAVKDGPHRARHAPVQYRTRASTRRS
jgi:hypothetical protein